MERVPNPLIRMYIKMVPPIRVKLTITSSDDDPFVTPQTFTTIPEASSATGLMGRGLRSAYHSSRNSMRKGTGEVYILEWGIPDHIRPRPPKLSTTCFECSKPLTIKDKSSLLLLSKERNGRSKDISSFCKASTATGISINALRNAC